MDASAIKAKEHHLHHNNLAESWRLEGNPPLRITYRLNAFAQLPPSGFLGHDRVGDLESLVAKKLTECICLRLCEAALSSLSMASVGLRMFVRCIPIRC